MHKFKNISKNARVAGKMSKRLIANQTSNARPADQKFAQWSKLMPLGHSGRVARKPGLACADPEGGQKVRSPWKITKKVSCVNTGPDPLKNRKATKPTFIDPPAKRHLTFRWRADDGPLILVKVGPPLTKLSGSAHALALANNVKPMYIASGKPGFGVCAGTTKARIILRVRAVWSAYLESVKF